MATKDFGARLYQARLRAGADRGRELSQSEVAEALGVKPNTISRYEAGDSEPSLETFVRLGEILRADPRWLAFGDPEEPAHLVADMPPPVETIEERRRRVGADAPTGTARDADAVLQEREAQRRDAAQPRKRRA